MNPRIWVSSGHMNRLIGIAVLALGVGATAFALGPAPVPLEAATATCKAPYNPVIDAANFKDGAGRALEIDNPYFPLVPGTTFQYRGTKDGQPFSDTVEVTHQKKSIIGIQATVVQDSVTVNGKLIEFTLDWYAQDEQGNVWYLGEFSTDYDENGNVLSHDGSWEAGQNNARPGIIMESHPRKGDSYRQEFSRTIAEDIATVMSVTRQVEVPYGDFDQVLQTKDSSCLESGAEYKYYAPGVGSIKINAIGADETLSLIDVTQ